MKNFIKNLFKTPELQIIEPIFPKRTIILQVHARMSTDDIKEMEVEYSEKMNVNVVILDGKFSNDIKVI